VRSRAASGDGGAFEQGARRLDERGARRAENTAHRGGAVAAWFDNLLPDSAAIRERLSGRFHTGSTRAFDLLAAIGRDCVGAVQLVPADSSPGDVRAIDAERLTAAEVASQLRGVTTSTSFGIDAAEGFRISIAGAQEKTALLRLDGRWYRAAGATPTTHILKLPLGPVADIQADMRDSVENEWLCMHLLAELGLPVAATEIATFEDDIGEQKALVVERFDRRIVRAEKGPGEWIVRLPQEDLCQANGVPAEQRYESDGGPGISSALQLLRAGNAPEHDALVFAKAQLAFWLLAATDGHAKNFSIFLDRSGYRMTPLYDVVSVWPIIGRGPQKLSYQHAKLAMALRGSRAYYHISRIPIRQWHRLALQTGVAGAFDDMVQLVRSADAALARVESKLPPHFPEHLWSSISAGVRRHRARFLEMVPSLTS
jgi:serine/threonine-protein kinase HipA